MLSKIFKFIQTTLHFYLKNPNNPIIYLKVQITIYYYLNHSKLSIALEPNWTRIFFSFVTQTKPKTEKRQIKFHISFFTTKNKQKKSSRTKLNSEHPELSLFKNLNSTVRFNDQSKKLTVSGGDPRAVASAMAKLAPWEKSAVPWRIGGIWEIPMKLAA